MTTTTTQEDHQQDDESDEESTVSGKVSGKQSGEPPSTLEQLGQAIKFIGTFVSWARAINPSTPIEEPATGSVVHSNAPFGQPALRSSAVETNEEEQLRKGLIGESPVDSGRYCC